MKLTISRNDLADLMSRGGSTVPKVTVIPIVQHARLIAKSRTLRICSTDLEMQAEAVGAANIEVEGETTVNALQLKAVVDRLPREAEVSIALDKGDLIVKAGRSRLRLPTLPVADFPSLDRKLGADAVSFALPGAALDRLLSRTAPIGSLSDDSRYYLQSVMLHVRGWDMGEPSLCSVATNGHILLLAGVEQPEGADHMPDVLIPTETANAILRLFRSEESVRVTVDRSKIALEGATTSLVSKLIDGTFPDYRRVIPESSKNRIFLDRAGCVATLSLLETFTTKDSGRKIEAAPADNGLALAAGDAEGDGFAVTEAEVEGDVPGFGFSSQYLKMMLGAFKAETLTVSVDGAGAPLRFSADKELDTIGVLMPMRTTGRLAVDGVKDESSQARA